MDMIVARAADLPRARLPVEASPAWRSALQRWLSAAVPDSPRRGPAARELPPQWFRYPPF